MMRFFPAVAAILLSGLAGPLFAGQPANASGISLTVPDEVRVGASFEVFWEGETRVTDYVTVVAEGGDAMGIDSFVYVGVLDHVSLDAPGEPGTYDVIYVREQGQEVLTRTPLTVADAAILLIAPESVVAGAEVRVAWEGDTAARDYITIVRKGVRDGTLGEFAYIRTSREVVLQTPAEPGDYEVRYHQEGVTRSLTRKPIALTRPEVTLEVPETVTGGAEYTVSWQNAIRSSDYLVLVRSDNPDAPIGDVLYVRQNSEATLTAPEEPGLYELRYMDEAGDQIVRRAQFEIVAPE